jgi:hypothetical protein
VRCGDLTAHNRLVCTSLQKFGSRADIQDMTSYDEPIYETVMRERNWDPERCEPLSLTTRSVGRHVA